VVSGDILPPANFLYYLVVYMVALSSTGTSPLFVSSALVLSLSVAAKFRITREICVEYYRDVLGDNAASDVIVVVWSVLLLIVFSLPISTFYLGQIPPNVWHNSTTIFVMPFALSLFWLSYKQLVEPAPRRILFIGALCVLNVFIKPSFFFVFSLSYPLMLVRRFGLGRRMWRNLWPVVVGLIMLLVLYVLIYLLSFGSARVGESGIAIRPFSVWSRYSSNIPLSLVASFAFPITYLAFYWREVSKHLLLQYSLLGSLISICIFVMLSETGPREFHGNFGWQCIICNYILFLVTTVLFAEKVNTVGLRNWKNKTILAAFLLHVLAGFLYLARALYTRYMF